MSSKNRVTLQNSKGKKIDRRNNLRNHRNRRRWKNKEYLDRRPRLRVRKKKKKSIWRKRR